MERRDPGSGGRSHVRLNHPGQALTPTESIDRDGAIPPLENGDRLTRDEFMRRYEAMPGLKKAELIEGVVYVPSPVRHRHHGRPHSISGLACAFTERGRPGLEAR